MRLAELAKLHLGDIELPKKITKDPDNMGSVRVRRKRNKEVTIPLNYKTCQALKAWLKVPVGFYAYRVYDWTAFVIFIVVIGWIEGSARIGRTE